MKKRSFIVIAVVLALLLCACEAVKLPALPGTEGLFPPRPGNETPEPVPEPTEVPAAELARLAALEADAQELIARSEELRAQYYYDEALSVLRSADFMTESLSNAVTELEGEISALVNYTADIPHIFFHSLIVYPEMIFTDKDTPMGGYNSGFSEKAELEKILPRLYERGYVLYDLDKLWSMKDGVMQREEILLPPGKTPLILSVDDVAYAYGPGYAKKLYLDENGALTYEVPNPSGGVDTMPDGDVMGVVDKFVSEHPDFAYQGHKGTIALTGFQGAFGYSYDIPEEAEQMKAVVAALKEKGWNFASHSYTHNSVKNFYGPGCSLDRITYDINKWVDRCVPCLGETRLFIAPFGYRVQQPMLQAILDQGFEIYCTVDNKVYNELNPDYALMSRIEIGGYSMTYYTDILNELFFNVSEVFDAEGRPPVI